MTSNSETNAPNNRRIGTPPGAMPRAAALRKTLLDKERRALTKYLTKKSSDELGDMCNLLSVKLTPNKRRDGKPEKEKKYYKDRLLNWYDGASKPTSTASSADANSSTVSGDAPATPPRTPRAAQVSPTPEKAHSVLEAASDTSSNDAGVLVAVFNTSGGGTDSKDTGARTPSENPGTTQTARTLFQTVVTCFLMYILDTLRTLPDVWLLTEVALSLDNGNMSLLSQGAPDASRSRKDGNVTKDAAVVWGPACNDAQSWTLSLRHHEGKNYYLDVGSDGFQLLTVSLKESEAKQYRLMLSRVAAAQLTLPVVGRGLRERCIFLSYHGPHKQVPEIKVQYLRWFLQFACSLAALGFHVVVGGDLNINPEEHPELEGLLAQLETVSYEMTARRSDKKKIDWLYFINNPKGDSTTRLQCGRCEAVDPAQHYRATLGRASCIALHPEWFDHDVLLARLRLVPK